MYVQKESYTEYLTEVNTNSIDNTFILDSIKMIESNSIVWKGVFSNSDKIDSPRKNWAYYNTTDGNAYIYFENKWNLLIENVSINYDEPTIIGTVAKSSNYDISTVYIKVVDNSNNSTVWNDKPSLDGDFVISGLDSSKTYTLYFSSEKLSNVNITYKTRSLAPDNTSTTYGAVMVDVVPLSGKARDIGEITLTPNGTVMGTVTLKKKTDFSNIDVYIADTSFATKTDNSGNYVISDVPQGQYKVYFVKDGYFTESKDIIVFNSDISKKPVETIPSFSLSSLTCLINGTVKDLLDQPINEAIITVIQEDGTTSTTSTNETGSFGIEVKKGICSISIKKTGYTGQFFSDVLAEDEVYPLGTVKMLVGTAGISGRMVLEGETNHSGATVTITNTQDNSIVYSTTTDDAGTYYFSSIVAGEYILKIQKTGFVTDQSTKLSSLEGVVAQAPVLTLKNTNSTIKGTITLSGTSNYDDVDIILTSQDSSLTYNATTLQSGMFSIVNVKPGIYSMTITKAGYETQIIKNIFVESAVTKTIDTINLSIAFASITGKVQLELRTDYAGALITATNLKDSTIIYSAITNSSGEFSFAEMYPGEYRLIISADNYVTTTLPTVDVVDDNTVDLGTTNLPIARGTISGLVLKEGYIDHSGVKVSLLGTNYTTTTLSDGSYSLSIPSGNYQGGIRFECEDFETTSYASTVPVPTNSTYAIPNVTLKCTNVPRVSGKVSIYGVTNNYYENITIKIAELPTFSYITTQNGEWFFEHVPVGTYTLEIERENARKVTKIIEVKPSPNITIESIELIPDSVTLTGNITLDGVSDYSGVTVRVTTPDSTELKTITNAAGYFYISNIVASKSHTIYFEKKGWDTKSFDIAKDKYEPLSLVNYTDEQEVMLIDNTSPILTGVSAVLGKSTESGREIYLYLNGSDNGSGIKYIQSNTTNSFIETKKNEFSNPFILLIPDELGTKTIYVRVEDASGNVSNIVSTSIVITNDKTELSGPLTGDKLHLTKEDSPYLMTNNVLVESNKTLIIDPGVEIQINGDYYIQVEGAIKANGTETERIKIYGVDGGVNNWDGIKILNDNGSKLSYVDISGLKNGITGYCDIDNALITSENWALGNNSNNQNYFYGLMNNTVIKGKVACYFCSLFDNKFVGDVEINYSNIDGNIFKGQKLSTISSLIINNNISSSGVTSVGDIIRYVTYDGCDIAFGTDDHHYYYPSTVYAAQFINCNFVEFSSDVVSSNFINCSKFMATTPRTVREKFDCTENYWGDINTAEIRSKGDGKNLSFITDYYDDFDKSRIDYSNNKETAISDIGYKEGYGRSGISNTYAIGDTGPAGGLIFYDKGYYSDGWRYLEAAPSDIGVYIFGYYKTDGKNNGFVGTASSIGSGRYNTERLFKYMDIEGKAYDDVESGDTSSEYAAKKCLDYTYGGRDDWFLPSKDELNLMYENLHRKGLGSFGWPYYWSSSEDNSFVFYARLQTFDNGSHVCSSRSLNSGVRALRAF